MKKSSSSKDGNIGVPRAAAPAQPTRKGRVAGSHRSCWRGILVGISYLAIVALGGVAVYLSRAPLPPLPEVGSSNAVSLMTGSAARGSSVDSLEICLRHIKTRDLFKPSVPLPTDDGLGKTTAQELADRLLFMGVTGEAGHLGAIVSIPSRGPGTFRVGDRVAEFVLKEVTSDRLVLGLGDDEAILKR